MPLHLKLLVLVYAAFLGLSAPVLAGDAPPAPDQKERCPVCGMFVNPYPNWTAAIVFQDGSRNYFDGPKDLFRFFFDMSTYRPGGGKDEVAEIWITEYYSTMLCLAQDVFFVTGSDVLGPMGEELVPIRGKEAAETFLKDHGGKKIMRFDGTDLVEATGP